MAKHILWENQQNQLERITYQSAEQVISGAPSLEIHEGITCIPQHFLAYNHSSDSVNQIIQDIQFDEKYPIFVGEESGQLYIQIGIIGKNNYKHPENANPNHIVYGRKWRVEANLPSGEIVQTAFLALKKAREHEIRELLQLTSLKYNKTSAPFSGHQDLTVLAALNPEYQEVGSTEFDSQLRQVFQMIRFDWHQLELIAIQKLPRGQYYIDVCFQTDDSREVDTIVFPELIGTTIGFIVNRPSINDCLHALIRRLIELSDQCVDMHFLYQGTAVFSPQIDIQTVAEISIQLRTQESLSCAKFETEFRAINFHVDATRVPKISRKQLLKQAHLSKLEGHLPLGI